MFSIQTPAKINLFLNIQRPQAEGYHGICTVMQAIRLWDHLDVSPGSQKNDQNDAPRHKTASSQRQSRLQLTCNHQDLQKMPAHNLVMKAYELFWETTKLPPLPLKVHLEKTIPIQAGLGGGSSNAAAMLLILNQLSLAALDIPTLQAMAAKLGSDVPFFIEGGSALVGGHGEMIESSLEPRLEPLSLVIIKPLNLGINTTLAYRQYDEKNRFIKQSPETLIAALRTGSPAEIGPLLLNDFESVLFDLYPLLQQTVDRMRDVGFQYPLLSGSGSAFFAFLEPGSISRGDVSAQFPPDEFEVFWTQTEARGSMRILTNPLINIHAKSLVL